MVLAQGVELSPREPEQPCRSLRRRRRHVARAVEQRHLAERRPRTFHVEHLLAAFGRHPENLDPSLDHDPQAGTRGAFLEDPLARREDDRPEAPSEGGPLRGRKNAEVGNAGQKIRRAHTCDQRGVRPPDQVGRGQTSSRKRSRSPSFANSSAASRVPRWSMPHSAARLPRSGFIWMKTRWSRVKATGKSS